MVGCLLRGVAARGYRGGELSPTIITEIWWGTTGAARWRENLVSNFHSTTILAVRHKGAVALGGDGQVTLGSVVFKGDANKIRRLLQGRVLTGFAGAAADAFALLERFEAKLQDYQGNIPRAAIELAKDWRTDRLLRRLE